MKNSIFACLNPVQNIWQLGRLPLASGTLVLIGWRTYPTPVDGRMPETVGEVLARAMTSAANVVFLSSNAKDAVTTDWKIVGDNLVCALKEESLIKRALNSLSNAPSTIVLLSTRKPDVVIRLFDDAAYPWWMQGQIALLSELEQPMPKINRQTLLSLFEDDWTQNALTLKKLGIQSVLRPGVDGSVTGFLFLTADFGSRFLKTLENESRAAGFDWNTLSETDFALSLAD